METALQIERNKEMVDVSFFFNRDGYNSSPFPMQVLDVQLASKEKEILDEKALKLKEAELMVCASNSHHALLVIVSLLSTARRSCIEGCGRNQIQGGQEKEAVGNQKKTRLVPEAEDEETGQRGARRASV